MNPGIQYPLVLHDSWLLESIIAQINKNVNYTNPLIKKDFVNPSSIKKAPILRIIRFLKTTKSSDLTAVLSDSSHTVVAVFPFHPTIIDFEIRYKHRITYHTQNSLIFIKQANLRFVNNLELLTDWGITIEDGIDVAVLEILDLEIFQRDQIILGVNIENSLQLVYYDRAYLSLCGKNRQKDTQEEYDIKEIILQCYDDVISI